MTYFTYYIPFLLNVSYDLYYDITAGVTIIPFRPKQVKMEWVIFISISTIVQKVIIYLCFEFYQHISISGNTPSHLVYHSNENIFQKKLQN